MNSKSDLEITKVASKSMTKKNSTALSAYIWNNGLNKNEAGDTIEPKIKWEILKECTLYRTGMKNCDLCTTEQLFILKNMKNTKNINHRSDLGNKCQHRNRDMLSTLP